VLTRVLDPHPLKEHAAMTRQIIRTDRAPAAIGPYSQAVRVGRTVYLSGQIPLDPQTMELVAGEIEVQTRRVFDNLQAVAEAAGGGLADLVKLNVFLTDLGHFARVNQVMGEYFQEPYPARAAIGVAALPRGAAIEMDGILELAD
jgi:reactive intermediate/imine deaminase